MNPLIVIRHVVLSSLLITSTLPAQEAPTQSSKARETLIPQIAVGFLNDQTGQELLEKHGIKGITIEDLAPLLQGMAVNRCGVRLVNWVVDEDASDTVPQIFDLLPFVGGKPPVPPSQNLSTRQLIAAANAYRSDRERWQTGIRQYQDKLQAGIDSFVRDFQLAQIATAERFDRIADSLARQGKNPDFNRSDINGSLKALVEQLRPTKIRVLILNSDCVDAPAKGSPRHRSFNPSELPEDVALIFVNTSKLPDRSPLFNGLHNPRYHADTMKDAVEHVVETLNAVTPDTTSSATTVSATAR